MQLARDFFADEGLETEGVLQYIEVFNPHICGKISANVISERFFRR